MRSGRACRSSSCWNSSGLEADALEVLFEGADVGTEPDHPEPMPFERSLPLAKALDPDTLLAMRMNGEFLEPAHGYPIRLFVPGWYGVASVKWLRRIEVVNKPFRGYFQSVKYTVQRTTERGIETEIVGPMMPKSEIIRPRPGDVLGPGANRLFGVAWAGDDSVKQRRSQHRRRHNLGRRDLGRTASPLFLDDVGVSLGGRLAGRVHDPGAGHLVARPGAAGGA